ncbi:MAG: metallopeptidase family protein [Propionibacteriaceae bacterium]|nr:metallopeptidase family protein [Propionibacteriaceae bacterium]
MAVSMDADAFEELVNDALDAVPEALFELLDNCIVVIEDDAPADDPELLGLYEGVPLTERGTQYGGVLPDQIRIFRNPTLAICDTVEDVVEEVHITVVHEIAHFFGIDDRRLHDLGYA